jgi:hypothetical protein
MCERAARLSFKKTGYLNRDDTRTDTSEISFVPLNNISRLISMQHLVLCARFPPVTASVQVEKQTTVVAVICTISKMVAGGASVKWRGKLFS